MMDEQLIEEVLNGSRTGGAPWWLGEMSESDMKKAIEISDNLKTSEEKEGGAFEPNFQEKDELEVERKAEVEDAEENPETVEENPETVEKIPKSTEENPESTEENPESTEENPESGEENPEPAEENPESVKKISEPAEENPESVKKISEPAEEIFEKLEESEPEDIFEEYKEPEFEEIFEIEPESEIEEIFEKSEDEEQEPPNLKVSFDEIVQVIPEMTSLKNTRDLLKTHDDGSEKEQAEA